MSARTDGLTLVEVVVALAVLAINLVGWMAAVHLISLLLQRSAALLGAIEVSDLVGVCTLGLLVMRPPTAPAGCSDVASAEPTDTLPPYPRSRRGFTLVEILVALLLAGLVFTLVAAGFVSTARFSRTALASGDALTVRLALPTVLRQAIEVAGRGVSEGCGLVADTAGRRLSVMYSAPGDALVVDEVFAAFDGGGRPALYLRRVPHARQPWIEEVTSFSVLGVKVDDDGRASAVDIVIEHRALHEPLAVNVVLPHRPCLEVAP